MGKLITPASYEQALGSLNEIKPLTLNDIVQRVMSFPVLNQAPVSSSAPGKNKLLRGDVSGAVLVSKNEYYETYETKEYTNNPAVIEIDVVFSQPVKTVLLFVALSFPGEFVLWYNEDRNTILTYVDADGYYNWPFYGTEMFLRIMGGVADSVSIKLYGFY